jgi:drug/metabolite transporter (DMT)-like permease
MARSAPIPSRAAAFSDRDPVIPSAETSHRREGTRGFWLVLGAAFFWGTSATLARHVFRDRHVPPLTVVELRLLIAAILLGAWLAWRRPASLRVAPRDAGYFLVLGVLGLAAVQGCYYYSISILGVGLAILIQYLAPSLIVGLDLLRGRRVSALTLVAVIAALAGTALLVGNIDPTALHVGPLQWIVSFGATLSFAFFILFSKRGLARYRPETVLFYTLCVASVFWAVVTPPWKIIAAGYGRDLWSIFLALALCSTLIPFALFYSGLRRLPAARVGVISTIEPVVAVVSAAIFLGESLRPIQNLGALFVLGAAALSSSEPHEGRG